MWSWLGVPNKDWFRKVSERSKSYTRVWIPKADVLRGTSLLAQNISLVAL